MGNYDHVFFLPKKYYLKHKLPETLAICVHVYVASEKECQFNYMLKLDIGAGYVIGLNESHVDMVKFVFCQSATLRLVGNDHLRSINQNLSLILKSAPSPNFIKMEKFSVSGFLEEVFKIIDHEVKFNKYFVSFIEEIG